VIIHVFSKVNTSNGYNEVRYRTTLTEFSSLPCGLLGSLVHDLKDYTLIIFSSCRKIIALKVVH